MWVGFFRKSLPASGGTSFRKGRIIVSAILPLSNLIYGHRKTIDWDMITLSTKGRKNPSASGHSLYEREKLISSVL